MALSNWDTLAFDSEGKPSRGNFTAPNGVSVEIYKNWLYVRRPEMSKKDAEKWNKLTNWSNGTISQVDDGNVTIFGIEIKTKRHALQSSVFCYIETREYTGPPENKYSQSVEHRMCGIGCGGFISTLGWLKDKHPKVYARIDPMYFDDKKYMQFTSHTNQNDKWSIDFLGYSKKIKGKKFKMPMPYPEAGEMWTGVTEKTATAFLKWLKTVAPKEYYNKIDIKNGLRFNQGDGYFADNLKGEELNATPIGQAGQPTALKLINRILPINKETENEVSKVRKRTSCKRKR